MRALITPEVLKWARERVGLSIENASKKIGIHHDQLKKWEDGELLPTLTQLEKIANVYKVPKTVFYLERPPEENIPIEDFRTLPTEKTMRSYELCCAIRRAYQRQKLVLEMASDTGVSPIFDKGKDIRSILKITLEKQFSWKQEAEAFKEWRKAIENCNVLVFQERKIQLMEMRGFSLANDFFPVIVLNSSDSYRGKIFTLFHELAHLQRRSNGLCDMNFFSLSQEEIICNELAGENLVPEPALKNGLKNVFIPYENAAEKLSNKFWVSQEVILRRLVQIGELDREIYEKKRKEFLTINKKKTGGGCCSYAVIKMAEYGHTYPRMVLDAYHDDMITTSDVSDYLEVKLKYVPEIEKILYERGKSEVLY